MSDIEPFSIHIAEHDLADLRVQLDRVRLPELETVPDACATGRQPTQQPNSVRKTEMQSYDVNAESTAPPSTVWTLLLDSRTWPTWSRVDALETGQSDGLSPDGRDGVGAVRAFRTGKVVTKERITALEPERRFAYEAVDVPQLTDYRAAVELSELPGGGTRIRWHGTYSARWGMRWFLQRYLRRFMQTMATGLAEHAAHLDAPRPHRD